MLNYAQNVNISGGLFTDASTSNVLDVLYKRVAPNAILNAGGRADEVKCHPGTREKVINHIENWSNTQAGHTAPILWLTGPAGAGKSAIMQTVAERCKKRGVPHANFFFFRGDPSRSRPYPLIATLLHQIILLYPGLREIMVTALSTNPLLFGTTFADQLEQLIVLPLCSITPLSSTYRPLLLLIDGLDECESETDKLGQQQILRGFDKMLTVYNGTCPFRLLVASRDESQIHVGLNRLSSKFLRLYLSDEHSPENDIRVFVNAQFEEVRRTHRLAHMLDTDWPSVDDVTYIVKKSSGQFIYAATVMRFISGSSASPAVSLERVRGITPLATKSPFSHLDAIYTYILSQVDDQEALKDILSAQLLLMAVQGGGSIGIWGIDSPFYQVRIVFTELLRPINQRYTEAIIYSCLEDLTPLIQYKSKSGQLLFHHESFSDYLLDQSRSGDYFVDIAGFSYANLLEIWKVIGHNRQHIYSWTVFGLCAITQLQRLPPGLMSLVASSANSTLVHITPTQRLFDVLENIHNLCTHDDDVIHFRLVLRIYANSSRGSVHKFDDIKAVPFGNRYFQMARADRDLTPPDTEMVTALRPQSHFDRQESALWLKDLLHHIYREIHPNNPERYKVLFEAWISWAVQNNISYDELHNLSHMQEHITGFRTPISNQIGTTYTSVTPPNSPLRGTKKQGFGALKWGIFKSILRRNSSS